MALNPPPIAKNFADDAALQVLKRHHILAVPRFVVLSGWAGQTPLLAAHEVESRSLGRGLHVNLCGIYVVQVPNRPIESGGELVAQIRQPGKMNNTP
jgi:hypothetical protein